MTEHEAGKESITEIKRRVARRIEKFEAMAPGRTPETGNGVTPKLLRDCMSADELGDGILFATLHRDRYLHNSNAQEWLTWGGHAWARDVHQSVLGAAETVVDCLLDATVEVSKEIADASKGGDDQKAGRLKAYRARLYERVQRLRTDKGRTTAVKMARTNPHQSLVVMEEEMNTNPWLLACKNGVIDLESGRFRDGVPADRISMAAPTEWRGLEEPATRWEQFLREVFDNDEELIAYLHRLFGMAIIGKVNEHIFPVLWGIGRNGKGTLVETFAHVLGPLAGSIQAEMLLSTKHPRSSAGPSPDIMGLKGLRLAFASETDEGQHFSPAKVKLFTGGDTLVGRHPHDKYDVRFRPSHTLILLTNHRPRVSPDDFAFWERLHLVPFKLSFVNRDPVADHERRADPQLDKLIKAEAPGILAWLVRGCLIYQRDGLNPPEAVTKATRVYQRGEDLLADFLELHCDLDKTYECQATAAYHRFNDWYKENIDEGEGGKGMSQKRFGYLFGRKFEKVKRQGGVYFYSGVRLKPVWG